MPTVQTPSVQTPSVQTPSRGAAATACPRRPHRRGPEIAVRLLGIVAAFLAFGLLGLLLGVWRLRPGRRRADLTCRSCRRRRTAALAGTILLAGLAVTGSGLAVQQHFSGPTLPRCTTERPSIAAGTQGHLRLPASGPLWSTTRQVLTAPISGLARYYVNHRGGGLCEVGSITMAFLPSAASQSDVTVGSLVLAGTTTASLSDGQRKALARHESRHITQWAILTLAGGPVAMPVLYATDDSFFPGPRNHFERAAGLHDGGYPQPTAFGPRPQWAKVTVIGLILLAVFRRRLRWVSRLLIAGAVARRAHEDGRCPLHSRGWFRLGSTATSNTHDL